VRARTHLPRHGVWRMGLPSCVPAPVVRCVAQGAVMASLVGLLIRRYPGLLAGGTTAEASRRPAA
jgi:hypothetical protein